MKKRYTRKQRTMFAKTLVIIYSIAGVLIWHHQVYVPRESHKEIITVVKAAEKTEYAYNERVPVEVVKAEIVKQAKAFNVPEKKALKIAECESGFNNLAWNDKGTANGVYQYVIATWQETESWKLQRIARTDYKYNIQEAMRDIAGGEVWRWDASKSCWRNWNK